MTALIKFFFGWSLILAAHAAEGTLSNSASATNFESFKLIAERNVFNQSRSPQSERRPDTAARIEPKIQALSLVGTMSYAKGDFAFFDGTKSEYRKPMKTGDKIEGYEIKQITPSSVKVANETNNFDIKVGQQLRKEDEGEWKLAATPAAAAETDRPKSAAGTVSEEEALKRLMEKRAKEL